MDTKREKPNPRSPLPQIPLGKTPKPNPRLQKRRLILRQIQNAKEQVQNKKWKMSLPLRKEKPHLQTPDRPRPLPQTKKQTQTKQTTRLHKDRKPTKSPPSSFFQKRTARRL